jgi:hypothetical protein
MLLFDQVCELVKHAFKRLFGRLGWLSQVHQFRDQFTVTLYFS